MTRHAASAPGEGFYVVVLVRLYACCFEVIDGVHAVGATDSGVNCILCGRSVRSIAAIIRTTRYRDRNGKESSESEQ